MSDLTARLLDEAIHRSNRRTARSIDRFTRDDPTVVGLRRIGHSADERYSLRIANGRRTGRLDCVEKRLRALQMVIGRKDRYARLRVTGEDKCDGHQDSGAGVEIARLDQQSDAGIASQLLPGERLVRRRDDDHDPLEGRQLRGPLDGRLEQREVPGQHGELFWNWGAIESFGQRR